MYYYNSFLQKSTKPITHIQSNVIEETVKNERI